MAHFVRSQCETPLRDTLSSIFSDAVAPDQSNRPEHGDWTDNRYGADKGFMGGFQPVDLHYVDQILATERRKLLLKLCRTWSYT
jgi:hypothetical protein